VFKVIIFRLNEKKIPRLVDFGHTAGSAAGRSPGKGRLAGGCFRRINQEVLQNGQGYETLRRATTAIGHRLTGSPNGRKAEEFTHEQFRQYGFRNVKFLPFEVEAWMRDTVALEIVPRSSDNFHAYRAVALAHSPVKAEVKGQLVDVGNGLAADFERVKDQVRGKVALVNLGIMPPAEGLKNLHRSEKTALAIQHGATGVVFVNQVKNNVLLTRYGLRDRPAHSYSGGLHRCRRRVSGAAVDAGRETAGGAHRYAQQKPADYGPQRNCHPEGVFASQ
jgi:hypothetical protein